MPSTQAAPPVDLERLNVAPDPEFGSHRPGLLAGDFLGEPEAYLRLVANPFLGLAYAVAWLVVLYETMFEGFAGALWPMFLVTLLAGLYLVPFFMEYHCLDCGRTGRINRWRKHVCHRVLERRESGRPRRFRGPTPPTQVFLWIGGAILAAMMLHRMNVLMPAG